MKGHGDRRGILLPERGQSTYEGAKSMNERRGRRLLAALAVAVYAVFGFGWSPAGAIDPDDAGGVIAAAETNVGYSSTGSLTPMSALAVDVTIPDGQFRCVRTVVTLRLQTSAAPATADLRVKRTVAGNPTTATVAGSSVYLGAASGVGATSVVVVGTEMLNEGTYTFTPQVLRTVGVGTVSTGNTANLAQRITVEDLGDAASHACFTVL